VINNFVSWLYNGKGFTSEDIPENTIGFVYLLTNFETKIKYVGKKLFFRTIKRPPLKGQKRKRKEIVESDWATYCGSSDTVKQLVEEKGIGLFKREILYLCENKGELSYREAKYQFDHDVLLRDD
jgi:hypothetical protein